MVAAWDAEYMRAPSPRRLLMLYLANDILQNSRRKVPRQCFSVAPPRMLRHGPAVLLLQSACSTAAGLPAV